MEFFLFLLILFVMPTICSFSVCIGNCPPSCWSGYDIPNGRITGCLGGEMCSYYCDEGYEKTSGMLTCNSGQLKTLTFWDAGSDEFCTLKSCATEIPNGELSKPCDAKVLSSCGYSCDSGYLQYSLDRITCERSTEWDINPHALCTVSDGRQCPYEIPHGKLDLSCRRAPGEQCDFTCKEGYLTFRTQTLSCEALLSWSFPLDSLCHKVICPSGIRYGTISPNCSREYNQTCSEYTCNPGYVKPPTPPSLKCNASEQWEWSKTFGQPCERKDKMCPSEFKNGKVTGQCHLQPGAECSFTCDPGCQKDWFTYTLTCGQNGEWDQYTGSLCKRCPSPTTAAPNICPATIPNGRISYGCKRTLHSVCRYTCDYGCSKIGITLQCKSNNRWRDGDYACSCSEYGDRTPSNSKSKGRGNVAVIVGIILAIVVLLVVGTIVYSNCKSRRRTSEDNDESYESPQPRTLPSAPPLNGSSTQFQMQQYNGQSPYSDFQSRQNTDSNSSAGGPSYSPVHTSDPSDPPPSYEQVTSDPSKYKS